MFCAAFPVQAGRRQTKTIRVAYPIQAGLTDIDENGNFCGYTYEYLEEVAQYTGWDYEFVQVPGDVGTQLSTLMDMLAQGQVDLMGGMFYSAELGEMYDYSGYSYGTVETVLQMLQDNPNNIVIDSQRVQTLRIAIISQTGRMARELQEYCEMNLIDPVFVPCEDDEQMLGALRAGEADVLLNSSLNRLDGVRSIARFAPKPFYFATSPKSDQSIITDLNEAIASITQADPYFQTTLYEKYFNNPNTSFVLSDREKAFVNRTGALRVGVCANQPPFQYRGEDGALAGMGVDLLDYISAQTGLAFTMVEAPSVQALYAMASEGAVDIIAGMPYDYDTAADQGLAMTRPYVSSQYILLMHESMQADSIAGKRLALPETSPYHGYFVGKVTTYESTDACIRAINERKADYTYVDAYTAQYYLNQPAFSRLKMVPQTYAPRKVCYGIAKPADSALLSLMNRAVLAVPMQEMQSIIYANTVHPQAFTLGSFVQRNPLQAIAIVAGVFLVVLALLLVILYQRVRASRAASVQLQKHLRLYAIANDSFFEYDYKTKRLIVSLPKKEGGTQAEVLTLSMDRPLTQEDSEESYQKLMQMLERGENCKQDVCLRCRDGKWHWMRVVLEVIADAAQAPAYAIGKMTMVDAEKLETEHLRDKAQRDSLTQLYNNEACHRFIAQELENMQADKQGALVLMDIDHFKSINDNYGHLHGDEVLQAVAQMLRGSFRSRDVIGRPGGDEFIIYMYAIKDEASLREKCAALCRTVNQIHLKDGRAITASVGAAIARAGQGYAALYERADKALYAAKDAGRNQYVLAVDAQGAVEKGTGEK
nr:transporter substrate-binding domain-containing protein [Maliibacterium massiliense]